jgi:hypothetical protein
MFKRRINVLALAVSGAAAVAMAGLSGSFVVPLDHEAIQYAQQPVTDPAAMLQEKLAAGMTLAYDRDKGYLPALLQALDIPVESQILVFSKTSFQASRITPRLPRALYFNDEVSVGWVRGGDVLEIASLDPKQGVIFYTLDQQQSSIQKLERRDTCLQCHATGATLGVPGLVVRSVFPDSSGMPVFRAGTFISDHRSPLNERWGGWYVSGTHGSQVHMGNALVRNSQAAEALETDGTQNVKDLSRFFDAGAYLTPHSDIVALMVLEHQTHMTNLLTRVGFETRMALHSNGEMNKTLGEPEGNIRESTTRRVNSAVEELLEYMLFTEETRLTEPVAGVSGFAELFAQGGPKDENGRSLRDLDLKARLFKYPCSYMIYSDAFDQLPQLAKDRLYSRLWEILSAPSPGGKFSNLARPDRDAIRQILLETKEDLPDYWSGEPRT